MNPSSPLIDAHSLQRLLSDAATRVVVIDNRFDLADPAAGERAYREAHLSGAHYLHLDRDLSGPKTGRNGRHPLPDRDAFAALIGRLGITPDTPVVAYDAQGGVYAARLWWMLRWLGHAAVAVLDGGLPAWVAAGGALTSAEPPPIDTKRPPYPRRDSLVAAIDADGLQRRLGRLPLIDARAPERFRGEVEPLDAQAGHIPGAINRFYKDNLDTDGRFKHPEQLRAEFAPLLGGAAPGEAVHQCGSGVTACHNLLAMEQAGLAGSLLYAGSWSEWSADPSRPVARG
jgi:thiosulfate/3-mercaptopyruvate sulfurtransferase